MDYYLYTEDVDDFKKKKPAESDLSKFENKKLNEYLNKEEEIEFENVKKSVKSKYYIGQVIVDTDNLKPINDDLVGEVTLEEDGIYKAIYQERGEDQEDQNEWWPYSTSSNNNRNLWTNSTKTKYLKFLDNLKWEAGEIKKEVHYPCNEGSFTIYEQIINLYKETEKLSKFYGTICFNFLNVESDDYGTIEVKSRDGFLSSEVLYNDFYISKKSEAKSWDVPLDGVGKSESIYEYEYKDEDDRKNFTNDFIRKYFFYDSYLSYKYEISHSVGYFEQFLELKKDVNFKFGFSKGKIKNLYGVSEVEKKIYRPPLVKGNYRNPSFQMIEKNNFDRFSINLDRKYKSPLENTGVTIDKFGIHYYNKPKNENFKLIFLGRSSDVVKSSYSVDSPNINILQKDVLNLPKSTILDYHFTYDNDTIQVSRGEEKETKTMYVYKDVDGNIIEKEYLAKSVTGENEKLYNYFYKYNISANLNKSHVIKYTQKNGFKKIIEILPLNKLAHFDRISRISEKISFKLTGNCEFVFKVENKKFRIYVDDSLIGKNIKKDETNDEIKEKYIEYVTVNDIDIVKQYYEVGEYIENGKNLGHKATIKIKYNKPMYGLVRDLTAFNSKLIKLLNHKNASWRYDVSSQTDIITVYLTHDLFLDLSNTDPLYLLNITTSLEKGIKEISLSPMRLKLGRVPYCFRTVSSDPFGLYFTENEKLYLDCAFSPFNNDTSKKIKIDKNKSFLPPINQVIDPNVYIYNSEILNIERSGSIHLKLDKLENGELKSKEIEDLKNKASVLNKRDLLNEVDFDLYELAGDLEESTYSRKAMFQTCVFCTVPFNFTINLVISYQTYNLTLYPDPSGFIKPVVSQTTFIPGDIIKIIFNLDNLHRLSTSVPSLELLKKYYSFYKVQNFKEFFGILYDLQKYRSENPNLGDKSFYARTLESRRLHNEQVFSFYILNKNINAVHKLDNKDKYLGCLFKRSAQRKEIEKQRNDNFEKYLNDNTKNLKLSEEEISLYFICSNADIDLWLSSELYENINILTLESAKTKFLRIEQSGFYLIFMAGSRCGNGGDGGRGLPAGADANKLSVSLAGSGGSFGNFFEEVRPLPHPNHNKGETYWGENVSSYGRSGGGGGAGWIGGKGGNGGNGSSLCVAFGKFPVQWGFGIWHFSLSFNLGHLPGLFYAGGKMGGPGGNGGSGFKSPGSPGIPGTATTITGDSSNDLGYTGLLLQTNSKNIVVNTYTKKVFLEKDTILMIVTGKNGEDGLNGDMCYYPDTHIFDTIKQNCLCGPDGSNGSTGLPSCIYTFNKNFKVLKGNSYSNKKFIAVEGLSLSKYKINKAYWRTDNKTTLSIPVMRRKSDGDLEFSILPSGAFFGVRIVMFMLYQCCFFLRGSNNYVEMKDILINHKGSLINDRGEVSKFLTYSGLNIGNMKSFKNIYNKDTEFWGARTPLPLKKSKNEYDDFKIENELKIMSKYGGKNPKVFSLLDFDSITENNIEMGNTTYLENHYVEYINNQQVGYDSSGVSIYFIGKAEASLNKEFISNGKDKINVFSISNENILLGTHFKKEKKE